MGKQEQSKRNIERGGARHRQREAEAERQRRQGQGEGGRADRKTEGGHIENSRVIRRMGSWEGKPTSWRECTVGRARTLKYIQVLVMLREPEGQHRALVC